MAYVIIVIAFILLLWYLDKKIGPKVKGEYTTDLTCPKCQKGNLLKIPNKDGVFICDECYRMIDKKLGQITELDYIDNRTKEEKCFDEYIENQNKANYLYRDMIKRGKRIVQAIRAEEKRIRKAERNEK